MLDPMCFEMTGGREQFLMMRSDALPSSCEFSEAVSVSLKSFVNTPEFGNIFFTELRKEFLSAVDDAGVIFDLSFL